jgi:energy-coupling factor transport system ATP-binding protein
MMEPIIRIEQLHHTYHSESQQRMVHALDGVDLEIRRGEYVTIVGHNGSGKSTLARHLNALLIPTSGDVWVKGWNTKDRLRLRDIRSTVGMVFQTPDNQIVATIVEEDVAFGPENLGVARNELMRRVDWALDQVEMNSYRKRAPHLLSGGQKQRVCIAGVLAMQPEILVLDEATAMLDPLGRNEVLAIARRLNKEQGVTVVAITHFMREAVDADRVVVMSAGRVVLDDPPRQVFRQSRLLQELHLDAPHMTQLSVALHARFPAFPEDLLTVDEVVATIETQATPISPEPDNADNAQARQESDAQPPLISVNNLTHFYMRDTPMEVQSLFDVSLEVHAGEIVGVIGHTGSGKSTVMQHFNGLMRPQGGAVSVLGRDMTDGKVDLREIRRRVGLVFQFAEAQLFEQFVGDDVAYGPRNLGLSREEVRARVRKAMESVGLGFEEFKDRFTFGLSGGQMRRVALAGVLALEPEVLVLDEPTAGLDPQGRRQLLRHILDLHRQGITLVIVSHNMEELAELCDRLYVIADGRSVLHGAPQVVFGQSARLRQLGLDTPDVTAVVERLAADGWLPASMSAHTLEQAAAVIARVLNQPQVQSIVE